MAPKPLRGAEHEEYNDSAYTSLQALIRSKAPQAKNRTNQRLWPGSATDGLDQVINRRKSTVRSRVEHAFTVTKRRYGLSKFRYRSLDKNATRALGGVALSSLDMARKRLLA